MVYYNYFMFVLIHANLNCGINITIKNNVSNNVEMIQMCLVLN